MGLRSDHRQQADQTVRSSAGRKADAPVKTDLKDKIAAPITIRTIPTTAPVPRVTLKEDKAAPVPSDAVVRFPNGRRAR